MPVDTATRLTRPPLPAHPTARDPGSSFAVTITTVMTALIGAVLFVSGLMLIAALFVVASLTALILVIVTGAVRAVTPRSTQHRMAPPDPHPPVIVDTTARVSSGGADNIRL